MKSALQKPGRKLWQSRSKARSSSSSDDTSSSSTCSSDLEAAVVAAAALAISSQLPESPLQEKAKQTTSSGRRWTPLTRIGEESVRFDERESLESETKQRRRSFGRDATSPPAGPHPPSRRTLPLPSGSAREHGGKPASSLKSKSSKWMEGSSTQLGSSGKTLSYKDSKREKREAKAHSWMESEMAKIDEFNQMDRATVEQWASDKINKARSKMQKIERELEEKKRKAKGKTMKEISKVQKKAERKMDKIDTRKAVEEDLVRQMAEDISRTGRVPNRYICC